jgi:hypothetical protein
MNLELVPSKGMSLAKGIPLGEFIPINLDQLQLPNSKVIQKNRDQISECGIYKVE